MDSAEGQASTSFIPGLYKPPSLLPIARHRESLLYLIETYPVVIVVGQTGSGKTTQVPQYLDQAGWCQGGKSIAVTQVGTCLQRFEHISNLANGHSQEELLLRRLLRGLRRRWDVS
jgi:hypothetical protein